MNWLHWWGPQFIILFFLLIVLAPNAGSFFLKKFRCKIESKLWLGNLEFIIGFCLVYLVGSLLVPLQKGGGILLLTILLYLKFSKKYSTDFRLRLSDLIVIPVIASVVAFPVAIDNLKFLQYSVFHNLWPLDWGPRLDVHRALAVLLSPWFKDVPLLNTLSVQAPFFGLMVWRGLVLCWEIIQKRKIRGFETLLLSVIYIGSLYYRKQIETKASPIGGFFAVLSLILLSVEVSPVILGFFLAASFSFGEYGGVLVAGTAAISMFTGGSIKRRFIEAFPWTVLFVFPEIWRKVFIFSSGSFLGLALAVVFCVLIYVYRSKISDGLQKIPEVKNLTPLLFMTVLVGTIVITLLYPMPRFDSEAASVWHWSLGCNGILFLVSMYYVWKNQKSDLSQVLINSATLQLIFLSLWHLSDYYNFFNPSLLWFNLGKNSMMITWPLLTTLLGTVFFSNLLNEISREKLLVSGGVLVLFFGLFQDPLVSQVGHGPFAPHSPRFSAYRNIYEMYWQTIHAPKVSSKSGNIILVHRSLPEADLVESVFLKQRQYPEVINVCYEPALFADYDIQAYTLEYFTGVNAVAGFAKCKIFLKPQNEACSFGTNTVFEGKMARLCEK